MQRRWKRTVIVATLALLGGGGCRLISGRDDLRPHSIGTGGSGQGGAAGGTAGGGVGGAGGGSGGQGGAAGAGACGTVDVLGDALAAGIADNTWYVETAGTAAGTVTEDSGGIVIALAADHADDVYVGLTSYRYYDLRGSRLFVRVPQMVSTATTAEAALRVSVSSYLYAEVHQKHGEIHYVTRSPSGVTSELASHSYSPAADLWWSIREDGGELVFETSADGASWTNAYSYGLPASFTAQSLRVGLLAHEPDAVATPGAVKFVDLNHGVAPGRWCPVGSLHDDFDGFSGPWPDALSTWPDPAWRRGYGNGQCTIAEQDGVLSFVGTGPNQECDVSASHSFDLTGSSVIVAIPNLKAALDADPAAEAALILSLEPTEFYQLHNVLSIGLKQGVLHASHLVGGASADLGTAPLDSDPAWLRIRESGGTVTFDASPDGANWSEVASETAPFAVTALNVELHLGQGGALGSTVSFDKVNLPP